MWVGRKHKFRLNSEEYAKKFDHQITSVDSVHLSATPYQALYEHKSTVFTTCNVIKDQEAPTSAADSTKAV